MLLFLACAAPDADGVDELPTATAFVGDPAGSGPATVTARYAAVDGPTGPLEATVWTPDTTPVGAVVLMPGFLATHEMYADYADHLASFGWLVVGFTFPLDNSYYLTSDICNSDFHFVTFLVELLTLYPKGVTEFPTR
jgi:hypothetical protein